MRWSMLVLVMLAGCATAGVKVDPATVATFKSGQTTYQQVVSRLGPPTSEAIAPDGSRVIAYSYVQASARPESFIPIIGPFVGGSDSRSTLVMFRFTSQGVLDSTTSSASQYGVSTGLFSGAGTTPRVDQPRTAQ